jgi:hypothetical protein
MPARSPAAAISAGSATEETGTSWFRYNLQRPHQGRWCFGKTPMQTLLDALPLAKEKLMAA